MSARLALAELRRHPSRAAAVLLAIMISVAFVSACLTFISTQSAVIGASVTAPISKADAVVRTQDDQRTPAQLIAAIRATAGVREVEASYHTPTDYRTANGPGQLELESVATDPSLRWAGLSSGRFPTDDTEIAISRATAKHAGLALGNTLSVTDLYTNDGTFDSRRLTVVGITDLHRSLLAETSDTGFVIPAYFQNATSPTTPDQFLIRATPGSDPGALVDALRQRLGDQVVVDTPADFAQQTLNDLTKGANVFRGILLVFGSIAALVGAIMIVNTFTILLVQRRRQIGLLRAIGASGRQVRHSVLIEALVIGAIGSILGVALGIGLAAIGSVIAGSWPLTLVAPWPQLAATALGGVLITVLAAALPARRASRIPPLDALRPVTDDRQTRRSSRLRLGIALAALVFGAALIGLGLVHGAQPLLLAVGGSFLVAIGVLALTPNLLPAVLGALGRLIGPLGPVARLAGSNSVRNPGRAAATCTALMLAVGLIVTLQVGSASTKTTVIEQLNVRFPVDLTVRADSGAVPTSVLDGIRGIPGVATVEPVAAAPVTVDGYADLGPFLLQGPGPSARAATRGGFDAVADDSVLLTPFTMKELGVRPGQPLTLRHQGHRAVLTVRLSNLPDDATLLTSRSELFRLDPTAPQAEVWASVPDVDRAGDVLAQVRQLTGDPNGVGVGELTIGGSLDQTAEYAGLLNTLLTIATALLAVAVLIALIGVGNTLGLSVLERTRESALLRALGLQRRQLRAMLVVEAIMLAVVGAVTGIAAGTLFGWLGTVALARQFTLGAPQFAMSGVQTLVVVGVAVVAGALASVVPGRHAARATPTQALVET